MRYLSLACVLLLVGCGGGGGSGVASVALTTPSTGINTASIAPTDYSTSNKTADFTLKSELYPLTSLKLASTPIALASSAKDLSFPSKWAGAITGAGLVAAIIDSGVDHNIASGLSGYYTYSRGLGYWPDLQTRLDGSELVHHEYTHARIIDPQCEGLEVADKATGRCTHGSFVAATINKYLPEARFVNITQVNSNATGDRVSIGASADAFSAKGVRFFNRSLGVDTDETVNNPGDFLPAVAYRNAIVVSAAGNEEDNHLITSNALPPNSPLKSGWIIALGYGDYSRAIDGNSQEQKFYIDTPNGKFYIYPRGNTCKSFGGDDCLSAPFTFFLNDKNSLNLAKDTSLIQEDASVRVDGTSFATPAILTAAMAVYAKYPWMSNDNIKETLFTTAYQVQGGSTAERKKYFGEGVLNAAAAMAGPAAFRHDFVADVSSGLSVFANNISGNYGLIKNGAGTLALTGANTFRGQIQNNKGVLWLTNTNTADVINNATLRLSKASIGALNNKANLISEGFSAKSLELAPNSKLYTNIGELISVQGEARLGGELNIVGLANSFVPRSETFSSRILNADSRISIFDKVLSNTAFLKITSIDYDNTGLSLQVQADNKLNNMPEINAYAAKNYESLLNSFDYLVKESSAARANASVIAGLDMSEDQLRGGQGANAFASYVLNMSTAQALAAAPMLFGDRAGELAASNLAAFKAMFADELIINGANVRGIYASTKAAGQKRDITGTEILFGANILDDLNASFAAAVASDNRNDDLYSLKASLNLEQNDYALSAQLMHAKLIGELDSKALAARLSAAYKIYLNENWHSRISFNMDAYRLKNSSVQVDLAQIDAQKYNYFSQSLDAALAYQTEGLNMYLSTGLRVNNRLNYHFSGHTMGAAIQNASKINKRVNYLIKAKFDYALNKNAALSFGINSEFAKNYFINQASFGFNYQF